MNEEGRESSDDRLEWGLSGEQLLVVRVSDEERNVPMGQGNHEHFEAARHDDEGRELHEAGELEELD